MWNNQVVLGWGWAWITGGCHPDAWTRLYLWFYMFASICPKLPSSINVQIATPPICPIKAQRYPAATSSRPTTEQFHCKPQMRFGSGGETSVVMDWVTHGKTLLPCSGFDCENQYLLCLPSTFSHSEVKIPSLKAHVWQRGFSRRLHDFPLRWRCQSRRPVNRHKSVGLCDGPVRVMWWTRCVAAGVVRMQKCKCQKRRVLICIMTTNLCVNAQLPLPPPPPHSLPGLHDAPSNGRAGSSSSAAAPKRRHFGCWSAIEQITLTPPPRGDCIRDTCNYEIWRVMKGESMSPRREFRWWTSHFQCTHVDARLCFAIMRVRRI